MEDGWCFYAKPSSATDDVGSLLRLAAQFFADETTIANEIKKSQFLFREASGDGANFYLGTQALCAIFEGLVDVIAKSIPRVEGEQEKRFLAAKEMAIGLMTQLPEELSSERSRIVGRLRDMGFLDMQQKFRLVCDHLGLRWDGLMQEHFAAWKKARHPAAHGALMDARIESFHDQAKVAGGIHLLTLRAMGYRGPAVRALFGGKEGGALHTRL